MVRFEKVQLEKVVKGTLQAGKKILTTAGGKIRYLSHRLQGNQEVSLGPGEEGKNVDEIRAAEGIKHGGRLGGRELLGGPLAHGCESPPGEPFPVLVEEPGMPDPGRLVFNAARVLPGVLRPAIKQGVIIISREALLSSAVLGDGTPFRGADRLRGGAPSRNRPQRQEKEHRCQAQQVGFTHQHFPWNFLRYGFFNNFSLSVCGAPGSPAACTTAVPRPRSGARTRKAAAAR